MASAAAMCRRSVLRTQSQKMASSGKRSSCLSLDTWARQHTGTTAASSPTSSSSGSSCTTEKDTKSEPEVQEACSREPPRCETPKSKKHRIPVVDVDRCPPAPKKPRLARGSNLMPKLGFSPGYLF